VAAGSCQRVQWRCSTRVFARPLGHPPGMLHSTIFRR
jgi:hypothetical protein